MTRQLTEAVHIRGDTLAIALAPDTVEGRDRLQARADLIRNAVAIHETAQVLVRCLRRTRSGMYQVKGSRIADYRLALDRLQALTERKVTKT